MSVHLLLKTAVMTIVLSLGTTAFSQTKKVAPPPKKALEKSATKKVTGTVTWTGYGVGKSHTGDVKVKSGNLTLTGEVITGGEIILDMKSITDVDQNKRLEGHLKSADFFDVEKPGFDTAKYVILKVEPMNTAKVGAPTHRFTGELTVKGKTNPLVITATVAKDGTQMTAKGEAEITDRTKFDIVYRSKQFESAAKLADKLIEDNIKVKIDVKTE